jgi:hypothetical protein
VLADTHDDTGWQVTVDQYFFDAVYYVVDTVVDQLLKDPSRHFICTLHCVTLQSPASPSTSYGTCMRTIQLLLSCMRTYA